jgi:predicted acyltransferase
MTTLNTQSSGVEQSSLSSPGNRLASLDVFRGATIAAMILVNNPGNWGAVYEPLKHAPWHGWTFTDLIFPFFLWIVGVAIPLSIARRLRDGSSRQELFQHAIRRALIIFALGFFLNSFGYFVDGSLFREGFAAWIHNYLTTVRIPGVLQRIAICYLVAVAIYLCMGTRGQVVTLLGLLGGYWAMMMLIPVPGFGAGVLEKEGNLSQYIDNLVLNGPVIGTHVWKHTGTWDPEGLLSTLPAIASCLFGVLTGSLLRTKLTAEAKTAWIYTGGAALLFCGQVMHAWFPINKNIWTSSFAVFTAGMAMVCFAACYWLVDVQSWRRWSKPFTVYGMNAITVFVLAGLLGRLSLEIKVGSGVALKTWLYSNTFANLPDPKIASLLWALMYVAILYLVAWFMYRRKWFVKF